jgi:hypothetical protein
MFGEFIVSEVTDDMLLVDRLGALCACTGTAVANSVVSSETDKPTLNGRGNRTRFISPGSVANSTDAPGGLPRSAHESSACVISVGC